MTIRYIIIVESLLRKVQTYITETDSKSSDSSGYSLINKDISDYLSTLTSFIKFKVRF